MRHRKPKAKKAVLGQVWSDKKHWSVKHGQLRRRRGRQHGVAPLFSAIGEKLPYESLGAIRKHLKAEAIPQTGVYVAHDSMGTPRYIGRGRIFSRLRSRKRKQPHELVYFSFYVVEEKVHEREVETLLIRAAGASLYFNERKKRIGIEPGSVRDFEAGTVFFVRQQRKGRKARAKRGAAP